MRPVCLLDRTKNLYQSDGLHFISDSLEEMLHETLTDDFFRGQHNGASD